eukprot:scaffold15056_cov101-Isochrysis_galbana.AAC.3
MITHASSALPHPAPRADGAYEPNFFLMSSAVTLVGSSLPDRARAVEVSPVAYACRILSFICSCSRMSATSPSPSRIALAIRAVVSSCLRERSMAASLARSASSLNALRSASGSPASARRRCSSAYHLARL